jgi:hypothetical protein
MPDPLTRGAAWVTLWEELLDQRVRPLDFVNLVLNALPRENTEQNIQLSLGYLNDAFWTLLTEADRKTLAPRLEQVLRTGLSQSPSSTTKATYFSAFRSTVTTPEGTSHPAVSGSARRDSTDRRHFLPDTLDECRPERPQHLLGRRYRPSFSGGTERLSGSFTSYYLASRR